MPFSLSTIDVQSVQYACGIRLGYLYNNFFSLFTPSVFYSDTWKPPKVVRVCAFVWQIVTIRVNVYRLLLRILYKTCWPVWYAYIHKCFSPITTPVSPFRGELDNASRTPQAVIVGIMVYTSRPVPSCRR